MQTLLRSITLSILSVSLRIFLKIFSFNKTGAVSPVSRANVYIQVDTNAKKIFVKFQVPQFDTSTSLIPVKKKLHVHIHNSVKTTTSSSGNNISYKSSIWIKEDFSQIQSFNEFLHDTGKIRT